MNTCQCGSLTEFSLCGRCERGMATIKLLTKKIKDIHKENLAKIFSYFSIGEKDGSETYDES